MARWGAQKRPDGSSTTDTSVSDDTDELTIDRAALAALRAERAQTERGTGVHAGTDPGAHHDDDADDDATISREALAHLRHEHDNDNDLTISREALLDRLARRETAERDVGERTSVDAPRLRRDLRPAEEGLTDEVTAPAHSEIRGEAEDALDTDYFRDAGTIPYATLMSLRAAQAAGAGDDLPATATTPVDLIPSAPDSPVTESIRLTLPAAELARDAADFDDDIDELPPETLPTPVRPFVRNGATGSRGSRPEQPELRSSSHPGRVTGDENDADPGAGTDAAIDLDAEPGFDTAPPFGAAQGARTPPHTTPASDTAEPSVTDAAVESHPAVRAPGTARPTHGTTEPESAEPASARSRGTRSRPRGTNDGTGLRAQKPAAPVRAAERPIDRGSRCAAPRRTPSSAAPSRLARIVRRLTAAPRRIIVLLIAAIGAVCLAVGIAGATQVGGSPGVVPGGRGETNILLVAAASSEPAADIAATGGAEATAIAIVDFSGDRLEVSALSLRPDTWVAIPEHGEGTLSDALAMGGIATLQATMQESLGIRIDHTVLLSERGIAALAGAGRLNVVNPTTFSADVFTFPDGPLALSAGTATTFLSSDPAALQRQQAVLDGAIRLLSDSVADSTAAELVGSLGTGVSITPNLSDDSLILLSAQLGSVGANGVRYGIPPVTDTARDARTVASLDGSAWRQVKAAFAADDVAGLLASGFAP